MVVGRGLDPGPATAGVRVGVADPARPGSEKVMLTSPFEAAVGVHDAGVDDWIGGDGRGAARSLLGDGSWTLCRRPVWPRGELPGRGDHHGRRTTARRDDAQRPMSQAASRRVGLPVCLRACIMELLFPVRRVRPNRGQPPQRTHARVARLCRQDA